MKRILAAVLFLAVGVALGGADGCGDPAAPSPRADTGVRKAHATVSVGTDGMTNEQRNVKDRLAIENNGAIKHLYIFSPTSGDVLLYSTVKGKVTSGGKRLTPKTVTAYGGQYNHADGIVVNVGGRSYETNEVLQDDGTYGDSAEYLYWWDQRGVYHQHFLKGDAEIHVSSEPIRVGRVILNLESTDGK